MAPPPRKLSPADAIPLLEEAIVEGERHLNRHAHPHENVVAWLQHVFSIVAVIEDLSTPFSKAFLAAANVQKTTQSEDPTPEELRDYLTKIALQTLRSQTKILRAKARQPVELSSELRRLEDTMSIVPQINSAVRGYKQLFEDAISRASEGATPDLAIKAEDTEAWKIEVVILLEAVFGPESPAVKNFRQVRNGVNELFQSFGESPHRIQAARRESLNRLCSILSSTIRLLDIYSSNEAPPVTTPKGNKVFIGHGRDSAWMKLQRFVEKRLSLETDDFDGVFAAGKTIPERLSEMLDSATFAFLVMTAEDAVTPEEIRARQNVVHEVGLFQGRLGFNRAIVLVEDGCTSFSNLAGIVYIPFPKGHIEAIFEKVRGTLEAHGLVRPSSS